MSPAVARKRQATQISLSFSAPVRLFVLRGLERRLHAGCRVVRVAMWRRRHPWSIESCWRRDGEIVMIDGQRNGRVRCSARGDRRVHRRRRAVTARGGGRLRARRARRAGGPQPHRGGAGGLSRQAGRGCGGWPSGAPGASHARRPPPARHRGGPRQRDDDPRRGGVRRARGPRRNAPVTTATVARSCRRRPPRPVAGCGISVVTGPKIGLRASRAKGRAKKIFDARVMMRWYGAPHTVVATGDVAGTKSPACESSD